MTPPDFAFAQSPLNRHAELRGKTPDFRDFSTGKPVACVQCRGDLVLMPQGQLELSRPADAREMILLGEDQNGTYWCAAQAPESNDLVPVRNVMLEGLLPPETLSIVAQAKSLLHWHDTHGHCARCGAKTVMADLGYRRNCPACGGDHFPRTDPVVIMAVRHKSKLLLGRQKSWSAGMYSALAGFMEPGETIEQAVAREVKEEAGVDVTAVRYVASQPWPFPSSLMIGVIADAAAETLVVEESELETARWFDKAELQQMIERRHPDGLFASHPYAIAHHLVKAALEEMT